MKLYIFIGLGGAIGSLLRYSIAVIIGDYWIYPFPLATFIANCIGAYLLSWFGAWIANASKFPNYIVKGINTGVIGSFTTFSTFSVETIGLLNEGRWLVALIYVFLSIAMGLYLSLLGYRFGMRKQEREAKL